MSPAYFHVFNMFIVCILVHQSSLMCVGICLVLMSQKNSILMHVEYIFSFDIAVVSPPVGSPVILLPTTPNGAGSTLMMQPQPYILVNPAEVPRINTAPIINTPNVYCGSGSSFILLSPSHAQSNSLLHVVSSPGISCTQTSKILILIYMHAV